MLKNSDDEVSKFCVKQTILWKFTPEHAPLFKGLWEVADKSFKTFKEDNSRDQSKFRRIVNCSSTD